MASYMPSEIARLVLGYLRETNCVQTWNAFLNESPHLKEFADGWRQGIEYSTLIGDKSLIQIINNSHAQKDGQSSSKANDHQLSVNYVQNQHQQHQNINNSLLSNRVQIITSPLSSSALSSALPSSALSSSLNYGLVPYESSPIIITHEQRIPKQCSKNNAQNTIAIPLVPVSASVNHQHLNHNIHDELQFDNVLNKTPFKSHPHEEHNNSDSKSPRRKGLPRRRLVTVTTPNSSHKSSAIGSSPFRSSTSNSSFVIDDNASDMMISPIDQPPVVQPEMIVEELLNFAPLHEALAESINRVFHCDDGNVLGFTETVDKDDSQKTITADDSELINEDLGTEEVPLADTAVQNIISNLELVPEFNTLLDMITEKELAMTPFKNLSPFGSSSAGSSLNTPLSQRPLISANVPHANVVKNLMSDLQTPKKSSSSITLYSSRNTPNQSPNSARIQMTPIKVTPIKVYRTNALSPHKTIFQSPVLAHESRPNIDNNKNVLPEDTFLIRFEPVQQSQTQMQQLIPTIVTSLPQNTISSLHPLIGGKCIKGKKVNFNKSSSELQKKRKLLPKPTTTITIDKESPLIKSPVDTNPIVTNPIVTNPIDHINSVVPVQRIGKFNCKQRVVRNLEFQNKIINKVINDYDEHLNSTINTPKNSKSQNPSSPHLPSDSSNNTSTNKRLQTEDHTNDDQSKKAKSQLGKVKAFSLSSAPKKVMGKRELEKQKKMADEEAAAEVYQEFVATFEDTPTKGKLFVRGNVINAASGEELSSHESGKVYKPQKFHEFESKKSYDTPSSSSSSSVPLPLSSKSDYGTSIGKSSIVNDRSEKPAKKKSEQKKKSNLELFKEELKLIQEEREERHRLKAQLKESGKSQPKPVEVDVGIRLADEYRMPGMGSYDTGDPNTTNIYLGNINPKMTEHQLCQLFGKYGPLASVKVMWPRSDEERSRNRNCGFVAFMNRRDGERALKNLNGKDIMDYEMKLGWGKSVPIPPHPIYIPPALMELTMPPPQSGLPFNAQPDPNETIPRNQWNDNKENFDTVLQRSVVKVVVPTDRTLLCIIHRMVEFVVREGPMFEAMIMNREINNPTFRFLFDNHSPAHVYYRWRLFSILQGEHPSKWRTEEFRMFEGGSLWRPPPLNPFLQGMPQELIEPSPPPSPQRIERLQKRKSESSRERREASRHESKRGMLSESQRDKFEDMLRNLTPQRHKIGDAMIYCIDHAEAAEEIVDCIAESLSITETPLYKKIARLYLINDILHNCSVKVTNASFFRRGFESRLEDIIHDIHDCFQAIEGRLKAEQFKQRVMSCFRAWEEWTIYPSDYLIKLQNIFLGLIHREPEPVISHRVLEEDVDGMPLGDHDIDGIPIGDLDGIPMNMNSAQMTKFKPSKWETVDPDVVEAQAMTTSKWEMLEQYQDTIDDDDDIDGKPFDPSPGANSGEDSRGSQFLEQMKLELSNASNSTKRAKLREIEVKVLKFQDELESGKRSRKSDMSVTQQIEEYRRKLMRKELSRDDNESSSSSRDKHRDRSPSPSNKKRRSRSRSRSRSPKRSHHYRHRSRSPSSRKRRSPSPSHRRRK